MNSSELRKYKPPDASPRKGSPKFVHIFEAGALVAIALLGYTIYAGLIELPRLRGHGENTLQTLAGERPAAVESQSQSVALPIGQPAALQFFGRQQPQDQSRFVSCVKLAGHEWRKVISALQAGIEPVSSQFATCMLSLNPGRLCEPAEVQNLAAFLKIYMDQKIAAAQPENRPTRIDEARNERPLGELRTETAGAAIDTLLLSDMRDLIAQGYLRMVDVGHILPVEAQAALAGVRVERLACR